MRNSQIDQDNLKSYGRAFFLFALYMVVCIAIFFAFVQKDVEKDTEETTTYHVKQQSYHFQSIINLHYEYLEGISKFLGEQESLLDEKNMVMLSSICEESSFEKMAIIDSEGISTYEDNVKKDVSSRQYFQDSMNGERSISDPLESKVDGMQRIILSVPIYKSEAVIGALAGSYDLGALSRMLFEDVYDGVGYSFIATEDGKIVSLDDSKQYQRIALEDNLFEYYAGRLSRGHSSMSEVKEDFEEKRAGHIRINNGGEDRYLTYAPLALNSWMMCYVVPVSKAQERYQFIRVYEITLSVALAVGILVLVFCLLKINGKKQKDLLKFAHTDALTGCRNKKNTEDKISEWCKSPSCRGIQVFLMLDIDKFKEINDVYGHAVGDEVLRQVGGLLKGFFREGDIIGRIGGDEFVVLMKNVNTIQDAKDRIGALGERFRKLEIPELKGGHITSSMGFCLYPHHGKDYMELYRCADEALYVLRKTAETDIRFMRTVDRREYISERYDITGAFGRGEGRQDFSGGSRASAETGRL